MTRRSGAHRLNERPATTERTRADVPAPTTVDEFLALFARGLDESHAATRMHR